MNKKMRIQIVFVGLLTVSIFAGCSRDPNVRKQKYLKSGNSYFQRGKYREAAIEYAKAFPDRPK